MDISTVNMKIVSVTPTSKPDLHEENNTFMKKLTLRLSLTNALLSIKAYN